VNPRLDPTPASRALSLTAFDDGTNAVMVSLSDYIEVFESGYEFLLAYAAQGRDSDGGGPTEVRKTLTGMQKAAGDIVAMMQEGNDDFAWVVADDAAKATAAIVLVLKQDTISSEMVDNLNASIHLRALLTDLFLVSEAQGQ
jgi:hypothetical protein